MSADTGATRSRGVVILPALLIGAAAAIGLGVFGKVHDPQFFSVNVRASPAALR